MEGVLSDAASACLASCTLLNGVCVDAVIAVAVIVVVLLVIFLRTWQLRRRQRLGYLVQNTWEFRLRNVIRRCFGMMQCYSGCDHSRFLAACGMQHITSLCCFSSLVLSAFGTCLPALGHASIWPRGVLRHTCSVQIHNPN